MFRIHANSQSHRKASFRLEIPCLERQLWSAGELAICHQGPSYAVVSALHIAIGLGTPHPFSGSSSAVPIFRNRRWMTWLSENLENVEASATGCQAMLPRTLDQ